MRIEVPHKSERLGGVRIHNVQEVWELDSGSMTSDAMSHFGWQMVRGVPNDDIESIEQRMAIVVPCKNERLKILDGVLSGIPHDCLIILVSASERGPTDRFRMECETVERFADISQRTAVMIHQQDPGVGEAFTAAGLPEVVDETGVMHRGKGEGMILGTVLAKLAGREFVGFIDADNYVPGAVHEYVKVFAAGFYLATSPYSMIRISWRAKPKIQGERLFFNKWGRTSQVTNRFLNLLLSEYSGFGTEIIATGNAGEQAISMELAEAMRYGGSFSIEPFQYIDLFEQFGGIFDSPRPDIMERGVEIYQVETRNPHFHEDKGANHVQEMRLQALNVLYHSPICPKSVRAEIHRFLEEQNELVDGEVRRESKPYPPLAELDWARFHDVMAAKAETFQQTELVLLKSIETRAPIERTETTPHRTGDGD